MSDDNRRRRLMQQPEESQSPSPPEGQQPKPDTGRLSRLQLETDSAAELAGDDSARLQGEFDPREEVERILKTAPFEFAPEKLAARLMARLAKSLKTEQNRLPEEARTALQFELSLTNFVMLPLMVAVGYLRVMAAEDERLQAQLAGVVSTLLLVVDALNVFVDELERLQVHDPEAGKLLVALLPAVLETLAEAIAPGAAVEEPLTDAELAELETYRDL